MSGTAYPGRGQAGHKQVWSRKIEARGLQAMLWQQSKTSALGLSSRTVKGWGGGLQERGREWQSTVTVSLPSGWYFGIYQVDAADNY